MAPESPFATPLELLREGFTAAAFATWLHIDAETRYVDGEGYQRVMPGEPCTNEIVHRSLIYAEGAAFHAYIVTLRRAWEQEARS